MRVVMLALAAGLFLARSAAEAGPVEAACCEQEQACCGAPDRCARCGCCAPCQKTPCRIVCEMKTVTKHAWRVECEEFCIPLPHCSLADLCAFLRRDRCAEDGCADDGRRAAGPGCDEPRHGLVRTRKKLVRVEYECKEPAYRCEVIYLCAGCAGSVCAQQ